MGDNPDLRELTIAVIGMGLMGGSLLMALQSKCRKLIGIDENPEIIALAEQLDLAEVISDDPGASLSEADVIVLATPVFSILSYLHEIPSLFAGSAIVLDLGSTKEEIFRVMEGLPARFDPIGGHPMCGKEKGSLKNADPQIYQEARFALTPLNRTSLRARHIAEQIVIAVGALPLWIDPVTHDIWTASTSHFPYLIANLLAACTPAESQPLVGPGFRSTSRLAGTNVTMMMDTILTNRERILSAAEIFINHFNSLVSALEAQNFDLLHTQLVQGRERYLSLTDG